MREIKEEFIEWRYYNLGNRIYRNIFKEDD